MANKKVKERLSVRKLTEITLIPEHDKRTESTEFRQTKKQLKSDGFHECWICGCKEDLNVHHFFAQHSYGTNIDLVKLKHLAETFDVYGYGKKMKDIPITSVDDIRNMMVLCREHHMDGRDGDEPDNVKNGIHDITFPAWISQKISYDGLDPVPDNDRELEQIKRRLELEKKGY